MPQSGVWSLYQLGDWGGNSRINCLWPAVVSDMAPGVTDMAQFGVPGLHQPGDYSGVERELLKWGVHGL